MTKMNFGEMLIGLFPDSKILEKFLKGFDQIHFKASHTVLVDVWQCIKFYGVSRKEFENKVVPILLSIQMIVYFTDFVVEEASNEQEVYSFLDRSFDVLNKHIDSLNIRDDKKIKRLF